jgi:C4-type Zn-finger protein
VSRVIGSDCPECGADIIAPKWSEHVFAYCVRNVWSCEACGHQFEDTVHIASELGINTMGRHS